MAEARYLKAVKHQPGRPLYVTVKERLCDAIDKGVFVPGKRIPSTKALSRKLRVSLVTAHRALQELESAGVLERSQGRGTFVHERYHERRNVVRGGRVGLVLNLDESPMYRDHKPILEGIFRGAEASGIDLLVPGQGEDLRSECGGYLLIDPSEERVKALSTSHSRRPVLTIGARSVLPEVACFEVDNIFAARLAVDHLAELGHRRIGYIGGGRRPGDCRDRWQGFQEACRDFKLDGGSIEGVVTPARTVDDAGLARLASILRLGDRPTAIVASGFRLALEVLCAAMAAGVCVARELSVVSLDGCLAGDAIVGPLTAIRQPLVELGQQAIAAMAAAIAGGNNASPIKSRKFSPELVVRSSTAPANGC